MNRSAARRSNIRRWVAVGLVVVVACALAAAVIFLTLQNRVLSQIWVPPS